MSSVFIVNNKNNRLAKVMPGLEQYFVKQAALGPVHFRYTERKKHAVSLAQQSVERGCAFLIAVGGDGTLHEVINGILQSQKPAHEYPVVGLLPYGSANDFARTAEISNSKERLAEYIRTRSIKKIDLGEIHLPKTTETRYFINIAGIGLGPEVVQKLERSSSFFGPRFNYFKHILKGFLRYNKKEVNCTCGNWQWQGKLLQMAVAKGKYFGNGICIAPHASLADGRFQISIFGDLSIWDYLKNLRNLNKGVQINHPHVSYHEAREVKLQSKDPCGLEADGEYVGLLPATLSVLPKTISFLMPI